MGRTTISFYRIDDWFGLYLNGKLVQQGHSMHASEMLDFLLKQDLLYNVNINFNSYDDELDAKMREGNFGHFPEQESELDDIRANRYD